MHEYAECSHGTGQIINPACDCRVGSCTECSLALPFNWDNPIETAETMLAHYARQHPTQFEKYAQKAASVLGGRIRGSLTAESFLDFMRADKKEHDLHTGFFL